MPRAAWIEISAIHWSSTSPSLGPHERTSRATVRPASLESPEAWRAAVATLLDETRVNGVATLREYPPRMTTSTFAGTGFSVGMGGGGRFGGHHQANDMGSRFREDRGFA